MLKPPTKINTEIEHPQVKINFSILVDKELALLVNELNIRGKITEYSCQNNNNRGKAYILFPKMTDVKWFAGVIEDLGLNVWILLRNPEYGGGASVDFEIRDIGTITNFVLELPKTNSINLNILERKFWTTTYSNYGQYELK